MIHEEARTIMRRIAMDYDRLAKLAEVQLIQEAIERKLTPCAYARLQVLAPLTPGARDNADACALAPL